VEDSKGLIEACNGCFHVNCAKSTTFQIRITSL
jgi:hypothetical protein